MSGGVDSAVAAGLLVREGYDVIGVTMRLWTQDDALGRMHQKQCCGIEDTDDARLAADVLGIAHYVMNLEEQFKDRVVDYFVSEYERGRTPNPCLACNEHVKFRALLDRAIALDADFLATGHYARIKREGDAFELHRAVDDAKDQSYVLYTLGQAELARLLLPVGAYEKQEIRRLALEMGLPLYAKPDSAEICFVPGNDYRAFLAERIDAKPGAIVDRDGAVVGEHSGIAGYTIGQRKGLGAYGGKRFVTALDPDLNLVTIGDEDDLLATRLVAEKPSWIAGAPPAPEFDAAVKVRYKSVPAAAVVRATAGRIEIELKRPQRALTPGQAAVIYDGDRVLGGGIIASALPGAKKAAAILPQSHITSS
jgi:tRNA-specific 2-thiouridylase